MALINKFTLVQVTASSGGLATIQKWTPSSFENPSLSTPPLVLGVTMTDSNVNDQVAVMKNGYLRDVSMQNSETWVVGNLLWGKSDGSITKTRPAAPLPAIFVGVVFDVTASLCIINVDVRVIPAITELSGVLIDAPADKDALIYNATNHYYETRQIVHNTDLTGLTTAGAHPASAISNTPAGSLASTDVQAAINELDTTKAHLLWSWLME